MDSSKNKKGIFVQHVKHAAGWWFDTVDETEAAHAWFQKAIEAGCDTDTLQSPPRDFTIRRMTLGEFESLDEASRESAEFDLRNAETAEEETFFRAIAACSRSIAKVIREGKSLPPSKVES